MGKKLDYIATLKKIVLSIILTICVYSFYYIEFIRENVEDFSFDIVNKFVLSTKEEKLDAPNLLLFKIDDFYLKDKKLLDENGETTYGYLFPRTYLAQIILDFDELLTDIEKENYPKALFIDYDMSYKSDPNNLNFTKDDLLFIDVLKKDRPYKIYIAKTANHNFIENLDDEIIQNKIKNEEIIFVSVGLTVSNDGVSRRYYPFDRYLSNENEERIYPLVNLEFYNEIKGINKNISKEYSQDEIALIENRIIFKEYKEIEIVENSEVIQSYWDNLKIYSANYPLDYIPEEDFKNAIIYLGGTHSNSDDFFQKDTFNKELSGIEMHANALMSMYYLEGKLNRLHIGYTIFILSISILIFDLFFRWLALTIKEKRREYLTKKEITFEQRRRFISYINFLKDDIYIFFVFGSLFVLSCYILVEYKLWFNWFIPSLMASSISIITVSYNFLKRRNIFIVLKNIWMIWILQKLFKFTTKEEK